MNETIPADAPDLDRLRGLLRKLFLSPAPDLDFGVYRLMRMQENHVNEFLDSQLDAVVGEALGAVEGQQRAHLESVLQERHQEVLAAGNAMGQAAFEEDGETLTEAFRNTPVGNSYRQAREDLDAIEVTDAQRRDVYNRLYTFFERYYQEGDFMPRRRWGTPAAYSLPYNGEETVFHWVNKDQHYVKSGENLQDFAFRLDPAGERRVRFHLLEATTPTANNQATRYYYPDPEAVTWDGAILTIGFRYQAPAEGDARKQDEILAAADPPLQTAIIGAVDDPFVLGAISERENPDDPTSPTLLLRRMRAFAKKNTTDYFIHRDLRGYMARELNAFIKDQVFSVEDINEGLPQRLGMLHALRRAATEIIAFLAAMEDAQKRLWERRKMVVGVDYIVLMKDVPQDLRAAVLNNPAQVQEWKDLYFHEPAPPEADDDVAADAAADAQDDEDGEDDAPEGDPIPVGSPSTPSGGARAKAVVRVAPARRGRKGGQASLVMEEPPAAEPPAEATPAADAPAGGPLRLPDTVNELAEERYATLPVDTRHFHRPEDGDFVDRLLASFDDLDAATGGLLVHSENYQALRLLQQRYRETVKCIYIDPPYNTDAGPIIYKNGYRHSSWLALVSDRLSIAKPLLAKAGITCITIDDVEVHRLRSLAEEVLADHQLLGVVAIKNNPAGRTGTVGFSICHEYGLFYGLSDARVGRLEHSEEQKARYKERDEISAFEWTNFRKHGGLNTYRTTRPGQWYPIYVNGTDIRIPAMTWKKKDKVWIVNEKPLPQEEVLWPIDDQDRERIWDFKPETARASLRDLVVKKDIHGETAIYRKWRLNPEGLLPQTWWDKSVYSAAEYGTNLLTNMFGVSHAFTFPKSVYAVADCLRVGGLRNDRAGVAVDYFAGSGSTGHAVIHLNREDPLLDPQGKAMPFRRFILVEMGAYFDTVLVRRIKKVMFAPEWRRGVVRRECTPNERARTPSVVKVVRLEGYEDALHNVSEIVDPTPENVQESQRMAAVRQATGNAYRTDHLLRLAVEDSYAWPQLARLDHPFTYTIKRITENGEDDVTVDLVETFNYLYGLHVERLRWRANATDKTCPSQPNGRCYRVVEGHRRDGAKVRVLWRDVEGLDAEAERTWLEGEQHVTAGGWTEILINGDCAVPGVVSLNGRFAAALEEGVV